MNFKIGDIVRIRQWDDMKDEFGINCFGNIKCKYRFLTEMRPLCGLRAKITHVITIHEIDFTYGLEFIDVPECCTDWNYSNDMFELVDDVVEVEQTETEYVIDVEPEELQTVTPEQDDVEKLLEELGGLF